MSLKRLWIGFALVLAISFGILGYFGREIYREAPPIPEKIVTADGTVLCTMSEIKDGQNVWQSIGGQEIGTVWGHGAYRALDWTADWLHREAVYILNKWAETEFSLSYEELDGEKKDMLEKLDIGLMLFVLRDMDLQSVWKNNLIRNTFWLLNIGLLLMVVLSVLPVGLAQTVASVKYGLWCARSAEFLESPALQTIRWLRVIGDTIFAIGALYLGWFVFGLKAGWSIKQ